MPPCGPQAPGGEPTCGTLDTSLEAIAVELLHAVADGREKDAGDLADALAGRVLSTQEVRLALQVREGGALAIARAVGLADRILTEPAVATRRVRSGGSR